MFCWQMTKGRARGPKRRAPASVAVPKNKIGPAEESKPKTTSTKPTMSNFLAIKASPASSPQPLQKKVSAGALKSTPPTTPNKPSTLAYKPYVEDEAETTPEKEKKKPL